jgi:hypothetical protein
LIGEILRLKRERYPDFSIRHFHEFLTERHGRRVSYTFVRSLLQLHGAADRCSGRGRYLRKRERRPLPGMLLHLDASTHAWIEGLAAQDLVVALDDADGRILYARFFPQEGVASTLAALLHVLRSHGRFCQLYTDRGSHFCRTDRAGDDPAEEQLGQVPRVLRTLGIEHIRARSPEARGRSERCFGTLQGRLPQELRLHGIHRYEEANRFLEQRFVADFNRRFPSSLARQAPPSRRSPDSTSSCSSPRSTSGSCRRTIRWCSDASSCSCPHRLSAFITPAARCWCTSSSIPPWQSASTAS